MVDFLQVRNISSNDFDPSPADSSLPSDEAFEAAVSFAMDCLLGSVEPASIDD